MYEAAGRQKGPSVTLRVIVVFLLPLLVFIGSLVIADKVLADFVPAKELLTFLSFLVAMSATLVWIVVIKKMGAFMGFNL